MVSEQAGPCQRCLVATGISGASTPQEGASCFDVDRSSPAGFQVPTALGHRNSIRHSLARGKHLGRALALFHRQEDPPFVSQSGAHQEHTGAVASLRVLRMLCTVEADYEPLMEPPR